MRTAFEHTILIARLTLLEAIRQRFFATVLILATLVATSSLLASQIEFIGSPARFAADLATGGVSAFGMLLAVTLPALLLHSEFENRTAIPLLAGPLHRSSYIVGKSLGFIGLCALYTIGVGVATTLSLITLGDPALSLKNLLVVLLGYFALFSLISTQTVCIASFSHSAILTLCLSASATLAGLLSHVAHSHWQTIENPLFSTCSWILTRLPPDLHPYVARTETITDTAASNPILQVILHATGYSVIFAFLATRLFSKRAI